MQRTKFPQTDRRTVLKSSAAILGVAGTGLGAIALTSREASAAVGFSVVDLNKTLAPDERIDDVVLSATLTYEYDSSHPLDEVRYELLVANGTDEYHSVTSTAVGGPPATDSGTVDLSGSIIQTPAFDATNFRVAEGSTIAVDVPVRATMTLHRGGEQVGLADAEYAARAVVGKEELVVSASLGGTGALNATVGTVTPTPSG